MTRRPFLYRRETDRLVFISNALSGSRSGYDEFRETRGRFTRRPITQVGDVPTVTYYQRRFAVAYDDRAGLYLAVRRIA